MSIHKAKSFATFAHSAQIRKYTFEPYIVHPAAVAAIVEHHGAACEVITAAWLHDTVEDCGVQLSTIEAQFGPRVAGIVDIVTDPKDPTKNRATRKALQLARFAACQGQHAIDVHTLKLADCLHNAGSIKKFDPNFWKVFRREVFDIIDVATSADKKLRNKLIHALK